MQQINRTQPPLTTIHPLWAICLCSGGWRKYCDTEMAISHEIKTNCSCCSCRFPVLNTNIPGLGGGCSWTGIKLRPIPYVMAQMAHLLLSPNELLVLSFRSGGIQHYPSLTPLSATNKNNNHRGAEAKEQHQRIMPLKFIAN